jgi:hypothetical protein
METGNADRATEGDRKRESHSEDEDDHCEPPRHSDTPRYRTGDPPAQEGSGEAKDQAHDRPQQGHLIDTGTERAVGSHRDVGDGQATKRVNAIAR